MGPINVCTTPRKTTFGKVKSGVQSGHISLLLQSVSYCLIGMNKLSLSLKYRKCMLICSISILKKARENIGSREYIGTLGFVGPSRLVVPFREPEEHSEKETQSSATTATACEACSSRKRYLPLVLN